MTFVGGGGGGGGGGASSPSSKAAARSDRALRNSKSTWPCGAAMGATNGDDDDDARRRPASRRSHFRDPGVIVDKSHDASAPDDSVSRTVAAFSKATASPHATRWCRSRPTSTTSSSGGGRSTVNCNG